MGIAIGAYHDTHNVYPMGYSYQLGYGWGGFGWATAILPNVEQAPLFASFNFDGPAWNLENTTACRTIITSYLCPSDETSDKGFLDRDGPLYAMSSYVGSFGPGDMDLGDPEDRRGIFSRNSSIRLASVKDGLSQTLFAGERHNGDFGYEDSAGHFVAETVWPGAIRELPDDDHGHTTLFQTGHTPSSREQDDRDAASRHPGVTSFLFGDGSVRFLKDTISLTIYQALSTRNKGEVISANDY